MFFYRFVLIILFQSIFFVSFSQNDSLFRHHKKITVNRSNDSNIVFGGTRIITKTDSNDYHKIEVSGYVSSYYAHYSDETEKNGFVQFPTMGARNNQFGLNMALVGFQYQDNNYRGIITLHYGDIAESNWPKPFTLIQEAHAGVRLYKKLWLDAGFFKTHIGIESAQPRENITSSMSVVNYYEPYFLSGAKLTYQVNNKLSVQANAFNGYNEYIEDNKNKALGFSALFDATENISITYNFLSCDETPDNIKTKHQRFYHDLYGTMKLKKLLIGAEVNYGSQKNTVISDSTKTAKLFSGLVVARYQILKRIGIYTRGEYFSDENKILTGNTSIGKFIYGITWGLEYKPLKNVSLNTEYRFLESDNLIFKQKNYVLNQRHEFIMCMDIWF